MYPTMKTNYDVMYIARIYLHPVLNYKRKLIIILL